MLLKSFIAAAIVGFSFVGSSCESEAAGLPFSLPYGLYVAEGYGCENFPMVGAVDYSADGFSGNKMVCKTVPTATPHKFQSSCVDAQAAAMISAGEIKGPVEPEVSTVNIKQTGPKTVVISGTKYNYCENGK